MTPPQNPFWPFFMLTGVTFITFASGFGVCLFDIDQIDSCVQHAEEWVIRLKEIGDRIINWFMALMHAILERHPIEFMNQ